MYRAKTAGTLAALALLLSITACTGGADPDAPPSAAGNARDLGPDATALLATFDIAAPDTVGELIDELQAQPIADRPDGLMASVRVDALLLSAGGNEVSVPLPTDEFHLSVAPYLDSTHECFYHSLTTCVGELGDTTLHVTITDDADGAVLIDDDVITYNNGFFDVTLPTDRDITLTITDGEHTAEVPLGTRDDDPTCVTSIQLT
jgi:hypothetical protein